MHCSSKRSPHCCWMVWYKGLVGSLSYAHISLNVILSFSSPPEKAMDVSSDILKVPIR